MKREGGERKRGWKGRVRAGKRGDLSFFVSLEKHCVSFEGWWGPEGSWPRAPGARGAQGRTEKNGGGPRFCLPPAHTLARVFSWLSLGDRLTRPTHAHFQDHTHARLPVRPPYPGGPVGRGRAPAGGGQGGEWTGGGGRAQKERKNRKPLLLLLLLLPLRSGPLLLLLLLLLPLLLLLLHLPLQQRQQKMMKNLSRGSG